MYFSNKKNPNRPQNFNLKAMHFINRLAIVLFIMAILYKLIRTFL
ncbi:DUF6728 family protein [Rhinopithecimicrobium faecis]